MDYHINKLIDNLKVIESQVGYPKKVGYPDETIPPHIISKIGEHCGSGIQHSLETGTGFSTYLFSHISRDHKCFSIHEGNLDAVLKSDLLNRSTVEFIEGPTQKTLPLYQFKHKLDVVLLDGPHGFPFPQLEYYYVYPNIKTGGILIIDDLGIPTIHHLFEFLRDDEMFEMIDLVDGNTAFFRRTQSPCFDPCCDGWWLQRYNYRRKIK